MPFDGNTYGRIALIAPIEYHPAAPSTAGVVSKSLAGAYTYCRTSSARRIGDQTFRVFSRDPRLYGTEGWVASTSMEDIAEFGARFIPGHATHIVARIDFIVPGTSGVTKLNARVVATSTGTDTGSTKEQTVELAHFIPRANELGMTPTQMEVEVELANITQDAQANVTVQAFCVDSGPSSRPFGVGYVVAWWESRD